MRTIKEEIIETIENLASDFLFYDRKEDENLSMQQLKDAVVDGEITIDEMVDVFKKQLINSLG